MIYSTVKKKYDTLAKPHRYFNEFFIEEIELCYERLNEAIEAATKDKDGNPIIYTQEKFVSDKDKTRVIALHYVDTQTGDIHDLSYISGVILGYYHEAEDEVSIKGVQVENGNVNSGHVLVRDLEKKFKIFFVPTPKRLETGRKFKMRQARFKAMKFKHIKL